MAAIKGYYKIRFSSTFLRDALWKKVACIRFLKKPLYKPIRSANTIIRVDFSAAAWELEPELKKVRAPTSRLQHYGDHSFNKLGVLHLGYFPCEFKV